MPIVPTIEVNRQTQGLPVVASRAGVSAPMVSPNRLSAPKLDVPDMGYNPAMDRASARFADTVGNIADTFVKREEDRADRASIMEVSRKLTDWEQQNIFDKEKGMLSRKGKAAFDNADIYTAFDKFADETFEGLSTQRQRDQFSEMALNFRNNIVKTGERHSRAEMDDYAKQQTASVIAGQSDRAIKYGTDDAEIMKTSMDTAKDAYYAHAVSMGVPAETIKENLQKIDSTILMGVLQSKADTDPATALEFYNQSKSMLTGEDLMKAQKLMKPVERSYKARTIASQALTSGKPAVNRTEAIDYVMTVLEGGDKLVPDGKGVAKYGINSAANPDVDVKNLTADGARALYRARYWDAIGAESLPADMRLVAFDTAVNHGVGTAKKLIEQADGDPRKLLELRAAEYSRLAKEDPAEYAASYDGWMNRLGKLQGQVDALRGQLPNVADMTSQINSMTDDPEVAEQATALISKQIKTIEDGRKASQNAASIEAFQYVRDGKEVPASIEARMSPQDVQAMRRGAPMNPQVYESLRTRIIAGEDVNLSEHVWQLGGKYDDLVELQQKPDKRPTARKVDDVIKNASKILLGKPSAESEEDFTMIENFRRAVDTEIMALEKAGKRVDAQDVEKITDKLLLEVSAENSIGWSSSKKRYEIASGQQFEVEGIPSNAKLYVAGQAIDYGGVVDNLTAYLESRNVRVTAETLAEAYKALVKSGKLVEKYDQ